MNIFKRLFCKHKYETITNIHGDWINIYGCRSMKKCVYCGKVIKSEILDKNCNKVNQL